MHAGRPDHGSRRRRRCDDAERRQCLRLFLGTIPGDDRIASFGRSLGECAAKQPGSEKCQFCHDHYLRMNE